MVFPRMCPPNFLFSSSLSLTCLEASCIARVYFLFESRY